MSGRGLIAVASALTVLLVALAVKGVGGRPGATDEAAEGAVLFATAFQPEQGLGPLFNATACVTCHNEPTVGGMGQGSTGTGLRVGRLAADGFDSLEGRGGPVARARSVAEFGDTCPLPIGIPPGANVTSVRNAPSLFGLGLVEAIPDAAILAEARRQETAGSVRGRPQVLAATDGNERVGRFGWKAQTARLEEFVGEAFRNELGITNPIAPTDLVLPPAGSSCAGSAASPEDDGRLVRAVTAFIMALEPPSGRAEHTHPEGARIFRRIGCAECHTPSLPGLSGAVPLYSDLLLHDLGRALDDGVVQGGAEGRDWRTTPLWGLRLRSRFLHDARAETLVSAIAAHGGEAGAAATSFRALTETEREALLEFLREL